MEETEDTEENVVQASSRRSTLTTRSPRATQYQKTIVKYEIPVISTHSEVQLRRLCKRHECDEKFIGDFDSGAYDNENVYMRRDKNPDARDIDDQNPSYTKFKNPLEAECFARYTETARKYNRQFRREIRKLIDYQGSALEAAYLVRVTAYTTLWPPYHNETEIFSTCRKFYRLTPKEQKRLTQITGMPYSKHY
ncbi:uncharacterized protein LOC111073729 [Drosophila obscura]|uniref:uncharacterized protein LOC111073729 n=1 Tax=Drosophila obscura TaxID=7282 RepID=UPI001BB20CA0|nr:uncharacterized protein LOC111073729 [Drosophila obscura]